MWPIQPMWLHTKQNYTKNVLEQFSIGSVYFAIRGKSTAGAILPLGKSCWLNWSCDKDNMLGRAFIWSSLLDHNPTINANPKPGLHNCHKDVTAPALIFSWTSFQLQSSWFSWVWLQLRSSLFHGYSSSCCSFSHINIFNCLGVPQLEWKMN